MHWYHHIFTIYVTINFYYKSVWEWIHTNRTRLCARLNPDHQIPDVNFRRFDVIPYKEQEKNWLLVYVAPIFYEHWTPSCSLCCVKRQQQIDSSGFHLLLVVFFLFSAIKAKGKCRKGRDDTVDFWKLWSRRKVAGHLCFSSVERIKSTTPETIQFIDIFHSYGGIVLDSNVRVNFRPSNQIIALSRSKVWILHCIHSPDEFHIMKPVLQWSRNTR